MVRGSPEKDIFLPDLLLENIKKRLETKGYVTGEELYYHNTFFLEGLKGIIRRWILRDCRKSRKNSAESSKKNIIRSAVMQKEIFFINIFSAPFLSSVSECIYQAGKTCREENEMMKNRKEDSGGGPIFSMVTCRA